MIQKDRLSTQLRVGYKALNKVFLYPTYLSLPLPSWVALPFNKQYMHLLCASVLGMGIKKYNNFLALQELLFSIVNNTHFPVNKETLEKEVVNYPGTVMGALGNPSWVP